ncbi:phospho-N-acetylmuramoyl-pentapeptide-transferase [Halobacillus andaensis]|uniref:Phospho-N-acetylmuramoyl-pentapeptide-transferase n=1 Tax=Halobacillus andaensis TaxID=1176239 RepID=A0A917B066_HALAA|nr:phospho-N-acetylmuramoyl-pentapeptide-transferase [Halobacillus andaensis]MBP2003586.1 phospho-N-acetylmuramoyl-pentapeptide-transferase [Halobacillus andaensis]GGF11760.1 phospho-N-acetylmuramoyl-pentapeptide-transferase [Halobacillus andaensis]
MNDYILLLTMALSFILTVVISPIIIPFLRRLKFGQSIRDEGPKSHQKKSGTPTMGGVMILISIAITTIVSSFWYISEPSQVHIFIVLFVLIGYGLLGFLDDYIKVALKRNLGLTSKQKMLGQVIIAIVVYFILQQNGFSTYIEIPGTAIELELGFGYALLILVMLVGGSNAVNLTDGLDGLLAGTAAIAFGAFGILAWITGGNMEVAVFCLAVVGALLGFLVFNAHPAKVFMGDTGSLALGGAIAVVAILTKLELLLVIIGGIFVIETLSVILQVASFKTTGKRIFRMSPLHHHYELKGWSEWRVVTTFWAVGFIFAFLGVYIEVMFG